MYAAVLVKEVKKEAKVLPKLCWGYLSKLCASGHIESTYLYISIIYLYTSYCISRGDRVNRDVTGHTSA